MNRKKDLTLILNFFMKKKPFVFIIIDGFGLDRESKKGNAVTSKTAPNIFSYMKKYPFSKLKAHGMAVGLFPNQEGNSEAGHLNIGAGRVVKQDIVMIWEAISDGRFFKNHAFKQALFHAKKYKKAVHVMGLLTNGQSAHAHPEHLYALLDFFKREKQKEVYLHLFTDGRDSPPHSALNFLTALEKNMPENVKIASIQGRFFAMDRNKIWERTKKAYGTIVCAKGEKTAASAREAIERAYERGETDEYITPTTIIDPDTGKPIARVEDNDTIYFFNSRSDRARQLTKAFVQKDFNKENPGAFRRKHIPKNIRFVAMTDFGPDLPGVFTAFPSPDIQDCLASTIGEDYKQLYISETEKYAHVTYFINGGFSDPINGEVREVIPSSGHVSYAENPDMSSQKLQKKILSYLKKDKYDFICVNFPNPDMVGHTGDFKATKKAVTSVDNAIKNITDEVLSLGGEMLIIADHGNAEKMIDPKTGIPFTEHTTNPVPCIYITKKKNIKLKNGSLSDVAPTILSILGKEKPKLMTGKNLLDKKK